MTIFKNAFAPPASPPEEPFSSFLSTAQIPPEEYDLNFTGGPVYALSTDKVTMIPFIPSLHAAHYQKQIEGKADMLKYMPYSPRPWESLEECLAWAEKVIRRVPGTLLYTIFDTSGTIPLSTPEYPGTFPLPDGHPPLGSMVGVIGVLNVDRAMMTSEVGHIVILPRAQRTHVNTHAVALLQHYCLDHPYISTWDSATKTFVAPPESSSLPAPLAAPFANTAAPSGAQRALGLRRCQWQANYHNVPSSKASVRLGFKEEGLVRFQRVLPGPGPGADEGREGDGAMGGSRTSWLGALTWRDWEGVDSEGKKLPGGGVKDMIDELVAR